MQNSGSEDGSGIVGEDYKIDFSNLEEKHGMGENLSQEKNGEDGQSSSGAYAQKDDPTVFRIVISNGETENLNPVPVPPEPKLDALKATGTYKLKGELTDVGATLKKGSLSRDESSREQCRYFDSSALSIEPNCFGTEWSLSYLFNIFLDLELDSYL